MSCKKITAVMNNCTIHVGMYPISDTDEACIHVCAIIEKDIASGCGSSLPPPPYKCMRLTSLPWSLERKTFPEVHHLHEPFPPYPSYPSQLGPIQLHASRCPGLYVHRLKLQPLSLPQTGQHLIQTISGPEHAMKQFLATVGRCKVETPILSSPGKVCNCIVKTGSHMQAF